MASCIGRKCHPIGTHTFHASDGSDLFMSLIHVRCLTNTAAVKAITVLCSLVQVVHCCVVRTPHACAPRLPRA
jgi:hypothetical protein